MGQVDQAFFPPRYWQQFEELTLGCFREILHDSHASKNGRSGFPQAGVDVYGRGPDGFTGIQCKQVDALDNNGQILPGGLVSKSQLKSEISKAEMFNPKLDVFIMAMTAPTDPKLQLFARNLNEQRVANGQFRIVLWFWDDFRSFLNASQRLQEWFYRDVLNLLTREDQDRSILAFFAEAFHRPAFQHPLSIEDFSAFPQAIEDTQTALRTGQLFDRRSRTRIRQSLSWRRLANREWRDGLERVDRLLATLRVKLHQAIADGVVVQRKQFMEIRDGQTQHELEDLRRACVEEFNQVLWKAQIDPI
ncbi:hypothetical protein [Bosea thiooxidans]